jgi:hypothetical protein
MFDFFDIFKVDPTISDPAVAAASGYAIGKYN